MMNGIQNTQSLAATYGKMPVSQTNKEKEGEVTSAASKVARFDTYTPSQEAVATMSLASVLEEDASVETAPETGTDTTTPEVGDGDVTAPEVGEAEGTDKEDTSVDTDEKVESNDKTEADDKVESNDGTETDKDSVEDEEDEQDDLQDLWSGYSDFQLGAMDKANMKITMMTTQFNTLASMLNNLNAGDNSISNQSWFADALTFSYAGKYLANAAAGNVANKNDSSEDSEVSRVDPENYNNYNLNGYESSTTEDVSDESVADSSTEGSGED